MGRPRKKRNATDKSKESDWREDSVDADVALPRFHEDDRINDRRMYVYHNAIVLGKPPPVVAEELASLDDPIVVTARTVYADKYAIMKDLKKHVDETDVQGERKKCNDRFDQIIGMAFHGAQLAFDYGANGTVDEKILGLANRFLAVATVAEYRRAQVVGLGNNAKDDSDMGGEATANGGVSFDTVVRRWRKESDGSLLKAMRAGVLEIEEEVAKRDAEEAEVEEVE